MTKTDYSLLGLAILALSFYLISDYCRPLNLETKPIISTLNFNPICYVESFNPESPDLRSPISQVNNIFAVNFSGTANSGVTASAVPSPSPEIPEA